MITIIYRLIIVMVVALIGWNLFTEKKLTAAKHKEKQLEHKLKQLTRSERTHRLCTRAGMLEKFLREPTLLTDDDVMELLTFIFHGEAVQKKLNLLIEKRKEEATTEDGEG